MLFMVSIAASLPRTASAEGGDVILLHGWRGTASNWSAAKAAYEAEGYVVHALSLPASGDRAGDTVRNADYVTQYIRNYDLTDVKLDGHSLGGWLAMYLAQSNPAVTSVVLRDTGTGCFWGIPGDQCTGSKLLAGIKANPPTVPVLNLSSKTTQHPGVDCTKVFNIGHNDFLTNVTVTANAIAWPAVNPCVAATPTPEPTPTPAPCSWWDRYQGSC
jgi:pimeloyl-ACP methyl ester carboxylesterase